MEEIGRTTMADRSLRGTGLGAKSFEDETGVEFAARQEIGYVCTNKHQFTLTFADDAEIPTVWECPRCGAESLRTDGVRPDAKDDKPARTHWDMLRERRSIPELEDLLAERLELLRSGALGPNYATTGEPSKSA
jgi:rubredoxin